MKLPKKIAEMELTMDHVILGHRLVMGVFSLMLLGVVAILAGTWGVSVAILLIIGCDLLGYGPMALGRHMAFVSIGAQP